MTPAQKALHAAEHVLLDFDGPVCAVFDGVNNSDVADTLRAGLAEHGYALPESLRTISDPFDTLANATHLGPEITTAVEHEFAQWEQHAVRDAPATPGARDVLSWINDTGRSLTIVSNNAVSAIETYLEHAGLLPLVGDISARPPDNADKLTPYAAARDHHEHDPVTASHTTFPRALTTLPRLVHSKTKTAVIKSIPPNAVAML